MLPKKSTQGGANNTARPPRKLRKRRTQTIAEKGTEQAPVLYRWEMLLDSYIFRPSETCRAMLTERDGKWDMVLEVNGKRFVGNRPTLEEAFKATDHLIYKQAKDYWLRSDASVVLEPWKGVLNDVA